MQQVGNMAAYGEANMATDEQTNLKPEQRARKIIDAQLKAAGWGVQAHKAMNLGAARGVAVREFPTALGPSDYLLYVDRKAIGIVEAKKGGATLSGVEEQAERYAKGYTKRAEELGLPNWGLPLPFYYLTNSEEIYFSSRLDPIVRPREVFHFHRPEHLLSEVKDGSLRQGLRQLGPLVEEGLRTPQIEALTGLEESMRDDRPRALVQMTMGGGKTIAAVAHAYRLLDQAKGKRILFLVDRRNLGIQAKREFDNWVTPEGRKFGELYVVQHLTSNTITEASDVVITTIQRLYSMLRGEEDFDAEREDVSAWESSDDFSQQLPVTYQPKVPVETFDTIFIDECHRSIYGRWGQVLDYFDAFLIGLSATPAKETYGYFSTNVVGEGLKPNVVSRYTHAQSVADGVNVDYRVFRVKTRITEQGSELEAGEWVQLRDKQTRKVDVEELEEDFAYDESKLDVAVVAMDQIRTVVRAFKEGLSELFPGRTEVPKTVIFCKDDSHAEDVLKIVRQEFARGSEFAKKITYRTEGSSQQAIQDFRTDPRFRIAVTVDQVSTGTDIKAIECLLFLRKVRSRLLFEQMKGRGVRTIKNDDLRAVTPDAAAKTHFVLVDAVGITDDDHAWAAAPPLDREPTTPLKTLLQRLAEGVTSDDLLNTLGARLGQLERRLDDDQRSALSTALDGKSLKRLAHDLVWAVDPETRETELPHRRDDADSLDDDERARALAEIREELVNDVITPLLSGEAREAILGIQRSTNQVIDHQSIDEVLEVEIRDDRAREIVDTWETFIDQHRDEYVALAAYFGQPHRRRLSLKDVRELANAISLPPHNLTPDRLWAAYAQLEKTKVKGAGHRKLADLVSLVRYATHTDDELRPLAELVHLRFDMWLTEQMSDGQTFTDDQLRWLRMVADHIAASLSIEPDDFDLDPFRSEGGIYRAHELFGEQLRPVLEQLNERLVSA